MSRNQSMTVMNPATLNSAEKIDETPIYHIQQMYDRSKSASDTWKEKSVKERLTIIRKVKDVMLDKMDEIIEVIAADTGKVKVEAVTADVMPVLDAISFLEKTAEKSLAARRVQTPITFWGKKSYIEYMARGTVLVISPWNYPLQLSMVPMLNALAAGNSVILKPSEVTPLVGKCIEQIFMLADFPKGLVQVAHGGKDVGAALISGKPDYIFFTGSVATGKKIQEEAAKELIPSTLELGGKDPVIIFADANLDRAAKGAAWGAFTNSGQVCMSSERIYVEQSVYAEFLEKLQNETVKLKQGTDVNDDIGSMTYPGQIEVIKEQLEEAMAEGARLVTGSLPRDWDLSDGLFIPPTIVVDVHQKMKLVQEETFGPVVTVMPFKSEKEAIALANDSIYGLNASVWSKDIKKAKRVVSKLITGNAVINDVMMSVANHHLPFGGVKHSGIGKYHGKEGIRVFCHEKSVLLDRGKKKTEIQWYPYQNKYPKIRSFLKLIFRKKTSRPS
ncbi:aldehyde dehydrogenase family protein [Peribacillus frigoritolerans]|uniref:aldehyde dehydrogenase family protein n=1 Tax=Peribacillus frigoritolerans TaxID=450367 RepID=UPI00105A7337|nr:aldehyde dehydrogenase family protein [Peribacillus frigoritolerans]TDL80264.1 aldehyde dehydrogenase family protein [Peribacillus frigoritolerans]